MSSLAVLVRKPPPFALPAPSPSCEPSGKQFLIYRLPAHFEGGCEHHRVKEEDQEAVVCNRFAPFIRLSREEIDELRSELNTPEIFSSFQSTRLTSDVVIYISQRRRAGKIKERRPCGMYLCELCVKALGEQI